MPSSCLADRLGDLVELSANEVGSLMALEKRQRAIRRGVVLVRENDRHGELFVLQRGMMMSYVLLADGSRQILRFFFAGDMLAASALVYARSPETIVALADSIVCPFERSAMTALAIEHPRLTALMMALSQIERVALTDRLAALGRTSAKARIAALLVEIRNSIRRTDRSIDATFTLGLTQEEIGDATGLTAVHVNRMIRQLVDEGIIRRENGTVTLVRTQVGRGSSEVDRFAGLDLGWLPPPR